MTEYTDCELCGREIGHWLGCEGAPSAVPAEEPPEEQEEQEEAVVDPETQCGRDDCTNERLPQGKGPRPKYCADHKTRSK